MKLVYFDNAATSNFKPLSVKLAFLKSLLQSANPGRSGHKLSIKKALSIYKTRETVANYFGKIEPENVIFTKNCTEALNIVIQGLAKKYRGNVIASCFEHNSVLRPLHELERQNKISLTIIKPKNKKFITEQDVFDNLKSDTFLVCVGSVSNVTGYKNSFEKIGELCHKKSIFYLLDNSQGVGHLKIDMKKCNIDFLTFSGHKGFLTPQGIGVLCINSKIIPSPIIFGGTGTESDNLFQPLTPPESFESGTLATSLICSLNAGIKYVDKNFDKNNQKLYNLTKYLIENLKQNKDIILYSEPNFSGVVGFNVKGFDSVEISDYLDEKYNIATRGGLHCAPLTHKFLGTTKSGIVRASLSFKNKKNEIDRLVKAILQKTKTPLS